MMRNKEIRLERLRELVREFGSIKAVADLSSTDEAYLGQILNRVKSSSGKPRNVGDELAVSLEKGCKKALGWMDRPFPADVDERARDTQTEQVLALLDRLTPAAKGFAVSLLRVVETHAAKPWEGPKLTFVRGADRRAAPPKTDFASFDLDEDQADGKSSKPKQPPRQPRNKNVG